MGKAEGYCWDPLWVAGWECAGVFCLLGVSPSAEGEPLLWKTAVCHGWAQQNLSLAASRGKCFLCRL